MLLIPKKYRGFFLVPFFALPLAYACSPNQPAESPPTSASARPVSSTGIDPSEENDPTEMLMAKAKQAASAYQLDRAWALAQKVWERSPSSNPEAAVILGDISMERDHLDDAISWYQKALDLRSSEGWILVRIADALGKQSKKNEARKALESYRSSHARLDVDVCEALGWLCLDDNDLKAAENAFECAVQASSQTSTDGYYGLAILAALRHDATATAQALASLLLIAPEKLDEVKADEAFEDMRDDPRVKAVLSPPSAPDAGPNDAAKSH